jgi:hypothetical protein
VALVLIAPVGAQAGATTAGRAAGGLPAQDMKYVEHGTQASFTGPAQNFTGSVRVDPLFGANGPHACFVNDSNG